MVEYFEIGLVSNTHGLKGEIKVRPYTESMKRFEELSKIYIESNNVKTEYEIEKVRYQKDVILLKLKGIDIIEDAEKLKNHIISIPREEGKTLSENEFFIADLIGCEVYESELIGTVVDVFSTGGSDVYVIKREKQNDLLLPAIASVIKNIDVKAKRIDVEIPRGLLDWDLMY